MRAALPDGLISFGSTFLADWTQGLSSLAHRLLVGRTRSPSACPPSASWLPCFLSARLSPSHPPSPRLKSGHGRQSSAEMTADVKILDERFKRNGHSRMRPGLFAASVQPVPAFAGRGARRRPRRQGLEGVLKPVVDAVVRPVRAPLFAQTPVSHPGAYEHLEAERIDCAIRVCEPQRARGRDAGYFG